jgi:hypothetical protein
VRHAHDPDGVAARVGDPPGVGLDPDARAVPPVVEPLPLELRLARGNAPDPLRHLAARGLREPVGVRAAEHLRGGEPEQPRRALVPVGDDAAQVRDDHRVPHVRQQQRVAMQRPGVRRPDRLARPFAAHFRTLCVGHTNSAARGARGRAPSAVWDCHRKPARVTPRPTKIRQTCPRPGDRQCQLPSGRPRAAA